MENLMRVEEKSIIEDEIKRMMSGMNIHEITLLYRLTQNISGIDNAIRLVRSVVNAWR
jgi:hypothetical protein